MAPAIVSKIRTGRGEIQQQHNEITHDRRSFAPQFLPSAATNARQAVAFMPTQHPRRPKRARLPAKVHRLPHANASNDHATRDQFLIGVVKSTLLHGSHQDDAGGGSTPRDDKQHVTSDSGEHGRKDAVSAGGAAGADQPGSSQGKKGSWRGDLIPRESLDTNERLTASAACIVACLVHIQPHHCTPSKIKIFRTVYGIELLMIVYLSTYFHALVLPFVEPPPRLYGAPGDVISEAGYSERGAVGADIACCMVYMVYGVLSLAVLDYRTRHERLRHVSALTIFLAVSLLLAIDAIINTLRSEYGIRPFRFLRPIMPILVDREMRHVASAGLLASYSLLRAYTVVFGVQAFFAVLGMNLFYGTVEDGNPLGAACLKQTGDPHPFSSFGRSFMNIYVLSTGHNFPEVVEPFRTCGCKFTPVDEQIDPPVVLDDIAWCSTRRNGSSLYFVAVLIVVFFFLYRALFAVCFFAFEKAYRQYLLDRLMLEYDAMSAAFYYLVPDGRETIPKQRFLAMANRLTKMHGVDPKIMHLIFDYLDDDRSQELNRDEFLLVNEFFHLRGIHVSKNRTYGNNRGTKRQMWSDRIYGTAAAQMSVLRSWALRVAEHDTMGYNTINTVIIIPLMGYAVLLSLNQTRKSDATVVIGDMLTAVFASEAAFKIFAYGFTKYWSKYWNRFELAITFSALITLFLSSKAQRLVPVLRCLRVLRLFAVAGRVEFQNQTFHQKLMQVFNLSAAACVKVVLLLLLIAALAALILVEMLSTRNINGRLDTLFVGQIDYRAGNDKEYDWSDMDSGLMTMMKIMVQNEYRSTMNSATDQVGTFAVTWAFLTVHFLGVILALNTIGALFVFVFRVLHDEEGLKETHEGVLQKKCSVFREADHGPGVTATDAYKLVAIRHLLLRENVVQEELHKRSGVYQLPSMARVVHNNKSEKHGTQHATERASTDGSSSDGLNGNESELPSEWSHNNPPGKEKTARGGKATIVDPTVAGAQALEVALWRLAVARGEVASVGKGGKVEDGRGQQTTISGQARQGRVGYMEGRDGPEYLDRVREDEVRGALSSLVSLSSRYARLHHGTTLGTLAELLLVEAAIDELQEEEMGG